MAGSTDLSIEASVSQGPQPRRLASGPLYKILIAAILPVGHLEARRRDCRTDDWECL